MNTIQRIVAATDFSAPASRAARRAARIAQASNAELHLLHVVHPLALYPGPEIGVGDLSRHNSIIAVNARALLEELAATLHSRFGVATQAATRIGRAHSEIVDYARAVEAGLVVAGARGENTLLDLLIGSTAARVLRTTACPVLIVKLHSEPKPYRDALVALDFSPGLASAPALCRAIAPEARVELLHVYDTSLDEQMRQADLDAAFIEDYHRRALAEAETRLRAAQPEGDAFTCHVMAGYPAAAIVDRVAALRAELVVVGRSGKSGMQEFLLGSVAKDVANAADCDVLVLPPVASEAVQA
ncbi:MAG: universal stress protein [Pseudomonadota bacterium]|nr:universal stress protein [Pseudomonadota bacterium]